MFEIITTRVDISVNGSVHVSQSGAAVAGVEIVEYPMAINSRAKAVGIRSANDRLGMDIVNVYGQRVHVRLAADDFVVVNDVDDLVVNDCHKVVMRSIFNIQIEAMKMVEVLALYNTHCADQLYWMERDVQFKKLNDPSLTTLSVDTVKAAFNSLLTSVPYSLLINIGIFSGNVIFAQGDSFKAGSIGIDWATDVSLKLIREEVI